MRGGFFFLFFLPLFFPFSFPCAFDSRLRCRTRRKRALGVNCYHYTDKKKNSVREREVVCCRLSDLSRCAASLSETDSAL